jgi:hypothetical protein
MLANGRNQLRQRVEIGAVCGRNLVGLFRDRLLTNDDGSALPTTDQVFPPPCQNPDGFSLPGAVPRPCPPGRARPASPPFCRPSNRPSGHHVLAGRTRRLLLLSLGRVPTRSSPNVIDDNCVMRARPGGDTGRAIPVGVARMGQNTPIRNSGCQALQKLLSAA